LNLTSLLNPLGSTMKLATSAIYYAAAATESPIITHDLSRQMMSILDRARVAIGLVYPQEL
jgi:hypothetical protein